MLTHRRVAGETRSPWRTWSSSGPAAVRRHIGLARRAAMQCQCFDAFARFGEPIAYFCVSANQLLHSIAYFCLPRRRRRTAPSRSCSACCTRPGSSTRCGMRHVAPSQRRRAADEVPRRRRRGHARPAARGLAPLRDAVCGMRFQANGAVLPMKFRAVLYLDVFGWLAKSPCAGTHSGAADPFGQARAAARGPAGFARQY